MPDITFVLPHLAYWLGILLFPLVFLYFVYRYQRQEKYSQGNLVVAYLFLICGGFMGLHRLYLKHIGAIVYIVLFLFILSANYQANEARSQESISHNQVVKTEFLYKRAIKKEDAEKAQQLSDKLTIVKKQLMHFHQQREQWQNYAKYVFYCLLLLIILDIFLLPKALKKHKNNLKKNNDNQNDLALNPVYNDNYPPLYFKNSWVNCFVKAVDTSNHYIGNYIAVWTLIAVFVFYYEVVVRYVFNSPTNWAHESMFLLFGMQYLYAGGFVLKEGGHVRVDVFYMRLSQRNQAKLDIVTSFFLFLFALILAYTGFTFFFDAFSVGEVSFTEWGVSYWPTKLSIFGGGVLLFLQGIVNVTRCIHLLQKT